MKRQWGKLGLVAAMSLVPTGLLAGCSGFWDAPPTTPTGPASGVFYVMNTGKAQIAAMAYASGATTPTQISGSPYTLGAAPLSIALSPTGSFLYVGTVAGIYAYSVGTGGALTLLNNQQPISNDLPSTMVVDPTGTWLVETTSGTGSLNAVPISATTGLFDSTIGEQTVVLPATTATQLAISPASSASPYVFLAMGSGGTAVIPFTAANTNPFGNVARIGVKNTSGGDTTVAVAPDNSLLFVGETVALPGTQTGGLRVFTVTASQITEITGSPFATQGTGPSAIFAPTGFVYVANRAVAGSSTGNITGYSVAADTSGVYTLTLINTVTAGATTAGLAEDSSKTYLLAVNAGGNPDLSTFTFDATTSGKLVAGNTAATGTDPVQASAIAALP